MPSDNVIGEPCAGKPHARFDEGKEEEIPPTYSTFIQHYFHTEPNEKAPTPSGDAAF